MAFAPDGKTIATSAWDGTIRIWNVATGKELRMVPTHEKQAAEDLCYSRDSKVLAAHGRFYGKRVELWDAATGRLRTTFDQDSVTGFYGVAVDFTGNDGQLVSASLRKSELNVRDLHTGKKTGQLVVKGWIDALSISPDGKLIAVTSSYRGYGEIVTLLDLSSGDRVGHLPKDNGDKGVNASLKFSPDGKILAELNRTTIRLWDVAARQLLTKFEKPTGFAAMAFCQTGKLLAVQIDYAEEAPEGSRISFNVWNVQADTRERQIHAPGLDMSAVLSAHGRVLATAKYDSTILLWDLTQEKNNDR